MAENIDERYIAIFQENYPALKQVAISALKNHAPSSTDIISAAEDLVQNTFLLAWIKKDQFLSSEDPKKWLYATLRYQCNNVVRKEWTRYKHQVPLKEASAVHSADLISACELRSLLSEKEAYILRRLYQDNSTYEEVAKETGQSKIALKMYVFRVKNKLKRKLQKI